MTRRSGILAGLLVACVAALAAFPPRDVDLRGLLPQRRSEPYPAESMVQDPVRMLDTARQEIESELRFFVSQLGVGVQLVVAPHERDVAATASAQLGRTDDAAWSETGRIRIVIGGERAEIAIESSENAPPCAAPIPERATRPSCWFVRRAPGASISSRWRRPSTT